MRCTCNEEEAAEGLAQIVPRSPVPIIADIHFQYKLALAAIEAGVQALRLNPGNIRKPEHIKTVAREAKDRGLPIRIGVNAGSLDPDIVRAHGGATPEALVASAQRELAYFAEVGFDDVKISVKASNVPVMIDAYRLLSETVDYPLHLGVTEAGPPPGGLVKSTVGHRHAARRGHRRHDPLLAHRRPGRGGARRPQLLEALGLRERKGLDLIACPSCGRAEVDVIRVANDAQDALAERNIPLQVAVMGCVVNGPGEAREADLGIAAGRGKGHLFVKGKVVRVVPEAEMVAALVEKAERIMAEGIEARLAAADEGAEAEAERDARGAAPDPGHRREPRRREDREDPRDRGLTPAQPRPSSTRARCQPLGARRSRRPGVQRLGAQRAPRYVESSGASSPTIHERSGRRAPGCGAAPVRAGTCRSGARRRPRRRRHRCRSGEHAAERSHRARAWCGRRGSRTR